MSHWTCTNSAPWQLRAGELEDIRLAQPPQSTQGLDRKTETQEQKHRTMENRKPENRLVVQARLRSVDQNQEVREHLHTAWPISSNGLPLLRNVMATLIDFGWTPHDPQLWTSPKGDWWRYASGTGIKQCVCRTVNC